MSRSALLAALSVATAAGGLLWLAHALLDRQTPSGPALDRLAASAELSLANSAPFQVFAIALVFSLGAVLVIFVALLRQTTDRRRAIALSTEALDGMRSLLAAQQVRLEELNLRLDKVVDGETARTDASPAEPLPAKASPEAPTNPRPGPAPLPLAKLPHVLRTPLHGILGHVQNLRRDALTPPQHLDAMEAIEVSGRTLLELLNDLVDLSRLESGESVLADQPFSLQQLVDDTLADMADCAAAQNVSIQAEDTSALPWTQGDAVRLRRLLSRLVRSAISSQAAAAREHSTLHFEVRHANDRLSVSLIGQQRATGMAAVGSTPESTSITETELDYLVGSRLVLLLGGDVLRDLSSGAFSARLPFKAVAPSMSPPSPTLLSGDIHCRLMVVEPRPELQPVCDAVLSGPQCTVETEQDLAEARRRLQRDPFDLVLLGLPGTTNRAEDAAAELRLVAAGAPAVIAVRNSSSERDNGRNQNSFDAVLERPLDPDQLVATVDDLLGQPIRRTVRVAAGKNDTPWPQPLGRDTAARIHAAVDLGDIESLEGLCSELAVDGAAPNADLEQLQIATRLFDLDALRRIADRCSGT